MALAHRYSVADPHIRTTISGSWCATRSIIFAPLSRRVADRPYVGRRGPKGARFDRHMEFVGEDGKVRVRAVTQWAIIDKAAAGRIRVPPEVIAPFVG